jgi:hypothetical protein
MEIFGLLMLVFCVTPCLVKAQTPLSPASVRDFVPLSILNNQRSFRIETPQDTLVQDTLTIIPNSIQIIDIKTNTHLDTSYFILKNNLILSKKLSIIHYPLSIHYRVLPNNLGRKFFRIDSSKIDPKAMGIPIEFEYSSPQELANTPIFEKGLEYNGNYTQGFSVGNAQNLVVNQNFNLNLAGRLGDLDIQASMTDNNLPIQAEGNTQQLREFDKIFIQLRKGKNTLIAGDYELLKPTNTYFLNYLKKLQGFTFSNATDFTFKKSITKPQTATLTTKASAAISRGKFARNILSVQEGNQGPYRLVGTEGGNFFIILSGTEKVFVDGKQMMRGEENDYIIDYNRGDIMFMPKRLVTKDSRIVVEFEYADQSFLRSTLALTNQLTINKLQLNFNFYNEQDSKNSSGTQTLDTLEKRLLALAGDNFENAAPLSIRRVDDGFRSDRIQYQQLDTVVRNKPYQGVLVYSNNPELAKFTATFTPVGEGKGSYVQDISSANGRVYRWVAPDSLGRLQGGFEPIRKLTPPNSFQMWTVGGDYQLSKNTKISTEVALSNNDRNRFSSIGDSANFGLAVFSRLQNEFNLGKTDNWRFKTDIKFEGTQRDFRSQNPYRSSEFTRDWNIPLSIPSQNGSTVGNLSQTPSQTSERFFNSTFQLSRKDWFSMTYDFNRFIRTYNYNGLKNAGRLDFKRKGWQILADVNQLNTEGVVEKTNFSRPKMDISKTINDKYKIGFYGEREKNQRTDALADTFLRSSFYYDLARFYFEKQNTERSNFGVSYSQRFDYQPFIKQFLQISKIDELSVTGGFTKNTHSQLNWNMTYRNLKVPDTAKTTLRSQETYLGRVEYNFNAFKNAIYANTLYEIGSGQEQKLEFQYVRVNKGEGQYVWRNRNSDTIPQLDEFEIAPFQDQADYVRISLYTNQFIRTNNVSFSQSLRLDPRAIWAEKQGFLKFLGKFSTNSTLLINRRVKNDFNTEGPSSGFVKVNQWNPFELDVPDRALVALTVNARNSFFFNRSSAVWDIEVGQLNLRNRNILVTGFEERARAEYFFRNRWNISKNFALQNYVAVGSQLNNSEAFQMRNYTLDLVKTEPQLTWMSSNDFRLILAYKYKNGSNTLKINGERITNNDFSLEATWNKSINSQFRTRFAYVDVTYTGERNTPIEFALLEGLQNGQNFLWNISLDRNLSKNMFLNITYEGRKTGDVRVVHVGRAAVRANF